PPASTSRAKARDPVTLARSPTLTKSERSSMLSGSRPASRSAGGRAAGSRAGTPTSACAMAAMCSGVVPQQPPAMLIQPARAHSPIWRAIDSGVSSYSPKALGSPAFGWQEVNAALEQPVERFVVGGDELVEADRAKARIVDIGRDRCGLVGRAEHSSHETRPLRRLGLPLAHGVARELGGGAVELARKRLHA